MSEFQVLCLVLSEGQAGDAPVGEGLRAEVLEKEEIKVVGSEPCLRQQCPSVCARHRQQGSRHPAALQPGGATGVRQRKVQGPQQVERLFCRLEGYRAVATHYDKLAAMFLGSVPSTLLAVSQKSIVSTS